MEAQLAGDTEVALSWYETLLAFERSGGDFGDGDGDQDTGSQGSLEEGWTPPQGGGRRGVGGGGWTVDPPPGAVERGAWREGQLACLARLGKWDVGEEDEPGVGGVVRARLCQVEEAASMAAVGEDDAHMHEHTEEGQVMALAELLWRPELQVRPFPSKPS